VEPLCLQAGFNYVVSETKTPTSDYTQAVLNSQNNYWTVTFDSSVVVDDKTDLKPRLCLLSGGQLQQQLQRWPAARRRSGRA